MKGLFAKHQYVGLDLGHHTIKAVQLEKTPSGWKLIKFGQTPTPKETIKDGVVIDPPVLGLVIKDLLKSNHIGATAASIGVSGSTMVVRPVRMPKMSEAALRKSIRFEASRYVPNSVEDSYIDFEIVGEAENNQMDVLIAAAPKDLVDGRLQACEHAGLEVENVEVASFALMRAAYEAGAHPDWASKTVALVDIGATITNLVLITEGTLAMVRTIPQGGIHLTETLMKQFKISYEDAEAGKAQLNLLDLIKQDAPAENRPLRTIQPQLDEMLREIRRSINYWQTQQTGLGTKQIDLILLTGGGSKFEGLEIYMSHKLGILTSKVNIFEKDCFWADSASDGLEWPAAVGLCMPLTKNAAKAGKEKANVSKPPIQEEAAEAEPEVEEAVEAPKKVTKKRASKKATEAEEIQEVSAALETSTVEAPPAIVPPAPPLEVPTLQAEPAPQPTEVMPTMAAEEEVPAAFRPHAHKAEQLLSKDLDASGEEVEATKPAKKPMFSVFAKKPSAPSQVEPGIESAPKASKPKFSIFGGKPKSADIEPSNPSEEDAA